MSYADLSVTNATDDEGAFTEEERDLIGREAAKLKKEFEMERSRRRNQNTSGRSHQAGGNQSYSYSVDPLVEETERSMNTLRDLDKQLQESMAKKQSSLKELASVQDALRKTRSELKRAERELHESARRFDIDRNELSAVEYKRDLLRNEIKDLEEKASNSKRLYSNTLEMNTSEILSIIEERDSLKRKLASGEGAMGYIERLELERQINIAKDELFSEQRSSRMRIDALQEELDAAMRKNDDEAGVNAELLAKIASLEREISDKTNSSNELQSLLRLEIRDIKNQVEDRKSSELRLAQDLADKERVIQDLQLLLVEKEKEISYEHDQRAQFGAEKNVEILNLKDSKEQALLNLTEKSDSEKRAALADNDEKHEQERRELIARQENRIADLQAENLRLLEAKEQEILYFKDKLRQQEEATRELGERLRIEAQEQVRSAVAREKSLWEDEHSRIMKRERNNWEDELSRTVARLNESVEYEKNQVNNAQKQVSAARKEIDEVRQQNKELHKDATNALISAREAVQAEHSQELSALRSSLTEERDIEVSRLQRQITELQDEVVGYKESLQEANEKIAGLESGYEHHEKTVVLEINDECRKISYIIGINPRKVNIDRYDRKARTLSPAGSTPQRTPVTDTLANLRACISELVPYVQGLRETIDSLKMKTVALKDEKQTEVRTLQQQAEIEKEKEVESVTEKLVRSHVKELKQMQDALNKDTEIEQALRQTLRERDNEIRDLKHNMQKWKEETASKLAREFEKEVEITVDKRFKTEVAESKDGYLSQQKMIIRMEDQISRLKAEQALNRPGSHDSSTVKLLRHLQDRVRQLKVENARLRAVEDGAY